MNPSGTLLAWLGYKWYGIINLIEKKTTFYESLPNFSVKMMFWVNDSELAVLDDSGCILTSKSAKIAIINKDTNIASACSLGYSLLILHCTGVLEQIPLNNNEMRRSGFTKSFKFEWDDFVRSDNIEAVSVLELGTGVICVLYTDGEVAIAVLINNNAKIIERISLPLEDRDKVLESQVAIKNFNNRQLVVYSFKMVYLYDFSGWLLPISEAIQLGNTDLIDLRPSLPRTTIYRLFDSYLSESGSQSFGITSQNDVVRIQHSPTQWCEISLTGLVVESQDCRKLTKISPQPLIYSLEDTLTQIPIVSNSGTLEQEQIKKNRLINFTIQELICLVYLINYEMIFYFKLIQ